MSWKSTYMQALLYHNYLFHFKVPFFQYFTMHITTIYSSSALS